MDFLNQLGISFQIEPAHVDESQLPGESAIEYLRRISAEKAKWPNPGDLSWGIDTIVVLENRILQKPESEEEALEMLRSLSGKNHSVFSGATVWKEGVLEFFFEETLVSFWDWSDSERWNYIRNQSPLDKAGSYGIQDPGSPAKEWKGSFWNVVGFPARSFFARSDLWKPYWIQS